MASAASVAGNVAKFRFSTDDFSERERLTAWREIFGRTVCRLDIEPLAGPRFQAESTVYALPGIGVLSGSCSGVDLTHSRELIVDDDLSRRSHGTILPLHSMISVGRGQSVQTKQTTSYPMAPSFPTARC